MERERLYISTIDPEAGAVARQYGLGIEIAEFCTAWNMDTRLPQTEEKLSSTLDGVFRRTLHGPFNELFPCAIDPKARELAGSRYRQAIALARQYGAKKVVLHGGYNPWLYYPQWYREQSIGFWREFLPDVPGDMEICLENVLEETPDMLLAIVQAVDDPRLKLCLDVGHCNAYSERPVQAWLEVSAPFLSHLHIHNNDGTGDTHSPIWEGTIQMRELLEQVQVLCPKATATLELMQSRSSVQWLLEE